MKAADSYASDVQAVSSRWADHIWNVSERFTDRSTITSVNDLQVHNIALLHLTFAVRQCKTSVLMRLPCLHCPLTYNSHTLPSADPRSIIIIIIIAMTTYWNLLLQNNLPNLQSILKSCTLSTSLVRSPRKSKILRHNEPSSAQKLETDTETKITDCH